MQSFAVPEGYVLDSAERLVIAYGDGSAQDAMVSWLGWPADSSLQWVWQDGYVLSDSGEVALMSWDGESVTELDLVEYGSNGLRRTFAGREPESAEDDFVFGSWSLGDLALERKSIKFGFGEAYSWTQVRGGKSYELSDHLGNVAVVVGDRKLAVDGNADLAVDFFEAEILSARDFYPFGMVMPDRSFSTQAYRYGFNGKEFDSEWKGEGNSYDYGFRVHDARLGRFLSVDPLAAGYPWYTPFQFAGNKAIVAIDLDGLEEYIVWLDEGNGELVKAHLDLQNVNDYVPFITVKFLKHDWQTNSYGPSSLQDSTLGFLPEPNTWDGYYQSLLNMYEYADRHGYIKEKNKIDSRKMTQFEKWLAKNTDASGNSRFHKAFGRTDGTGEKKEATGAVSSTDHSSGERNLDGNPNLKRNSKPPGTTYDDTTEYPNSAIESSIKLGKRTDTVWSLQGSKKGGGSLSGGRYFGRKAAEERAAELEEKGYNIKLKFQELRTVPTNIEK
jgi:RHS repeat-associated protein